MVVIKFILILSNNWTYTARYYYSAGIRVSHHRYGQSCLYIKRGYQMTCLLWIIRIGLTFTDHRSCGRWPTRTSMRRYRSCPARRWRRSSYRLLTGHRLLLTHRRWTHLTRREWRRRRRQVDPCCRHSSARSTAFRWRHPSRISHVAFLRLLSAPSHRPLTWKVGLNIKLFNCYLFTDVVCISIWLWMILRTSKAITLFDWCRLVIQPR